MSDPEDVRRTPSGIELKPVYGPDDVPAGQADAARSLPGEAPYTRGAYPGMYRSKPWRIFQLSGHGNPEDEGERIRFLLKQSETGFTMEHDRNTADHLYGVDHPEVEARHEDVGLTGAVIIGVRDYETVLDGIDIGSLYAHPGGAVVQHGPFALACYWTVAKRRGLDLKKLAGTGQSDYFLTYLGCIPKQQVPTDVGLRLNCDIVEFCAEHLPRWVPISIAAYNGADTGLNAPQELGALLANAVEHLDRIRDLDLMPLEAAAKGLGGVNFRVSMEFFEDIAKLRASRKMWNDLLLSRYGITDEKVRRLRMHIVTAGSAMTYQQPLNNIVRGTIMALASALGGTQSLGVSGYDEALSVPSEHAHQMSLRIQQILQEETNLTSVADPLGGSYLFEALTAEVEERAWEFFEQIQDQGGFTATLDSGWLHERASENQLAISRDSDTGRRSTVGVTDHTSDVTPFEIDGFQGTTDAWERAVERLHEVRRTRDSSRALEAIRQLEATCASDANVMPAMLEAVDADVTLGEIGDVFRGVFGDWDAPITV
jgi:methylmalonyl-CoA mutase, N-terminal domain